MKLIDIITSPWAIMPEKLVELRGIYETHLKGEKIDIKAVEARIGKPLDNRPQGYEVVDGVAVIPIDGVIAKRMNLFSQISGGVSTDLLARDFKAAINDPLVKAIVLAIDSPGGTVDGTVDIARLVYESRGVKPIVAYTDGTMASAAYWIGSAADKVYIGNDATLVGSIGVVATHQDISKAQEMAGVKTTEVYAGKYKRIVSQYAPLTEAGQAYLQDRVDYLYSVFVSAVADNRGVPVEKVLKGMADGKVFSGRQAIEAGLVDGVATLDALIADMKSGGVPGKIKAKEEIMAEEKKEEMAVITAELLSENHPDVFKAIQEQGSKAERERIQGVFSLFRTGREKLITEFMFDGKSTKADASVAILEAEDARKEAHLKALKDDASAIKVPHAEPGDMASASGEKKIEELVNSYKKENGCSDKDALLVVSKTHPELFRERR
ncbi:MAG: signal peptide peptidase SppA [Deltaproteobacteria bacterium]|nr:signal peptide peptidase SppA [Deltaproteobacteria bacterium]